MFAVKQLFDKRNTIHAIHHFLRFMVTVTVNYGFICGAYMPISNFSEGLQKVLSFFPGTYGTGLLRNHAMRGVFEEMELQGFPAEVVEAIKDSVDCNLYFFGDPVEQSTMYVVLISAIVIAVGLYIVLNLLMNGRKRRRKTVK